MYYRECNGTARDRRVCPLVCLASLFNPKKAHYFQICTHFFIFVSYLFTFAFSFSLRNVLNIFMGRFSIEFLRLFMAGKINKSMGEMIVCL